MKLVPQLPTIASSTIEQFIRAHVEQAQALGALVAMSGGVDSSVVVALGRRALGADRVAGLLLPDGIQSRELTEETLAFAAQLGVSTRTIAIDGVEKAVRTAMPELQDRVAIGNVKARIRMLLLYAQAWGERRIVLGTGNKSELLLGYFTKYGDGAADLLPLGDLYKTEVWELAEVLDIPPAIRKRPPTAGFWEGQTDEAELGLPYRDLDRILFGYEQLRSEEEIAQQTGMPLATVQQVLHRVTANRHKRRLPPIPKIGLRTIGVDWRD